MSVCKLLNRRFQLPNALVWLLLYRHSLVGEELDLAKLPAEDLESDIVLIWWNRPRSTQRRQVLLGLRGHEPLLRKTSKQPIACTLRPASAFMRCQSWNGENGAFDPRSVSLGQIEKKSTIHSPYVPDRVRTHEDGERPPDRPDPHAYLVWIASSQTEKPSPNSRQPTCPNEGVQ